MVRFTLIVLSIVLGALIAIAFIIKGLIMMKHERLRELERIRRDVQTRPVKRKSAKRAATNKAAPKRKAAKKTVKKSVKRKKR